MYVLARVSVGGRGARLHISTRTRARMLRLLRILRLLRLVKAVRPLYLLALGVVEARLPVSGHIESRWRCSPAHTLVLWAMWSHHSGVVHTHHKRAHNNRCDKRTWPRSCTRPHSSHRHHRASFVGTPVDPRAPPARLARSRRRALRLRGCGTALLGRNRPMLGVVPRSDSAHAKTSGRRAAPQRLRPWAR